MCGVTWKSFLGPPLTITELLPWKLAEMSVDLPDRAVRSQGIARFGPFELDARSAELRKSGSLVRLQEQPLRLLLLLLERAGEVVKREELRERLWSADTFVDFDHSVNTAVRKLRAALDDSAETPRFVETLARHGYRFIAPVEWIPVPDRTREATRRRSRLVSALAAAWKRRSVRLALATGAAVIGAAGLIGGTWVAARRRFVRDPPTFELVTHRRGGIWFGGFAAGNQVVFSADYDGPAPRVYVAAPGSSRERTVGEPGTVLWAVSRSSELAVRLDAAGGTGPDLFLGTLARMPLDGGAPKRVVDRVIHADWMPAGRLAALRLVEGRYRFEMPVGNVVKGGPGGNVRNFSVSPDGSHVAWLESFGEVSSVVIFDRRGHRRIVRGPEGRPNLSGSTVWSPDSRSVWFNDREGGSTSIYKLDLDATRMRLVTRLPGTFGIHDIAENGDVLLEQWERTDETYAVDPGGAQHDLTRSRASMLGDLSRDGKVAVVTQNWWGERTTFLHAADGSPPIRIEEGMGGAIAPDAKSVLVVQKSRIVIAPVGPGQPFGLPASGLSGFGRADWGPDGRHVVFTAARGRSAPRVWVQAISGGAPQPITPAGVTMQGACACVSPDGRWIAADADGRTVLYSVDGRSSREIAGMRDGERPLQFSSDGRALFVAGVHMPFTIVKVDLATGSRTAWKTITPDDPFGARALLRLEIADDGSYAYTILRGLSRLYVMRGLR